MIFRISFSCLPKKVFIRSVGIVSLPFATVLKIQKKKTKKLSFLHLSSSGRDRSGSFGKRNCSE
jgi:hypothetical protein